MQLKGLSYIKNILLVVLYLLYAVCVSAQDYIITLDDNAYKEIRKQAKIQAEEIGLKFLNNKPYKWGTDITGIAYRFIPQKNKAVVLTFDACGGRKGSKADEKLINFLIDNKIKSTLFVNIRWIEANKAIFEKIVASNLFEIENHGIEHRPLSTSKKELYGISGTNSPEKAAYEVIAAGNIIKSYTNKPPCFFRSGTAYYDDVALKILDQLQYTAVAFSINADYGASIPANKIVNIMNKAKNGDIVIAHINRPESQTANGMIESISNLQKKGFLFKHLSEVELIKK